MEAYMFHLWWFYAAGTWIPTANVWSGASTGTTDAASKLEQTQLGGWDFWCSRVLTLRRTSLLYQIMYNEDWSHVLCEYYFSFTWVDNWLKSGHPNSADVLFEQSHSTSVYSTKVDPDNQSPWDYYKFCPGVSGWNRHQYFNSTMDEESALDAAFMTTCLWQE